MEVLKNRFNRIIACGLMGGVALTGCTQENTTEKVYFKVSCAGESDPTIASINQDYSSATKEKDSIYLDCFDDVGVDEKMLGIEPLLSVDDANIQVTIGYNEGFLQDGRPAIETQPNEISFYGFSTIHSAEVIDDKEVGE